MYCCTPKALYNHMGGGGSLLNHHQCEASTWIMRWLPQDNGASALTTHQLQVEKMMSHGYQQNYITILWLTLLTLNLSNSVDKRCVEKCICWCIKAIYLASKKSLNFFLWLEFHRLLPGLSTVQSTTVILICNCFTGTSGFSSFLFLFIIFYL